MLKHFGVTPYMVFDGDFLPSKAATEEARAKKRDEKSRLATELLNAGKPTQAAQEFQKCIDITPDMASSLIQYLKTESIPYVVAPYEADAQLVYLERHGYITGILSDDSDLLVFGARRLLTKLDQYGNCIEINRRDFCACREVSLTGWSDTEFRRMAILSGCDYLAGLPGVGLKTAYRMLRSTKNPERVVRMIQFQGKRVSENYLTQFYQAELTFLHQWVFCPDKKELVHLTPLDGTRTADEMPFIGAYVEPHLAQAIAKGDVNPITKENIAPSPASAKRKHSQATPVASNQPSVKPINSYFRGHSRRAMGEMDPNCFSVEPQRLAQITDGGLAPRIFPLPRPYIVRPSSPRRDANQGRTTLVSTRTSPRLQRQRTEPISHMLPRLANGETTPDHPFSKTRAVDLSSASSKPQSGRPSKKARLCDDYDEESRDISPKKSRFFGRGSREHPGCKTSDGDMRLLSDDSVEEALSNLPDFDSWTRTGKPTGNRITIYDDKMSEKRSKDKERCPDREAATPAEEASGRPAAPPPSPSAQPGYPGDRPPSESSQMSQPGLGRFSFSSTTSSTPASTFSRHSAVFSATSTPSTAPSTATSRLTPLQRLGAKALHDPTSPDKPRSRESTCKKFLSGLPVNPCFVPLPRVDLREVEALSQPNGGSEDQLAPITDGEEEEAETAPKKLDLLRFLST